MLVTHYDNLQVKRNASQEVIRGAYKHLSQKWHPDKNPENTDEAERILKIINAAYDVLSDLTRRKQHDEWIKEQERYENASKSDKYETIDNIDAAVVRLPYRPKVSKMFWACLFFSVAGYLLSGAAIDGDVMSIGFIDISSEYSTYIYWGLVVSSILFVVIGLISIIVGMTSQHHLLLTDTSISAPRHILSRNPVVIPLSSVKNYSVSGGNGDRILVIRHQHGKINILESMLLSDGDFDQFHNKFLSLLSQSAG